MSWDLWGAHTSSVAAVGHLAARTCITRPAKPELSHIAGDFAGNQAFRHLALSADDCLNRFKVFCVPPRVDRATLHWVRPQLFLAPGVLVRPQRQPTLRLAASYPYREAFLDPLRRIDCFRPPRGEQPFSGTAPLRSSPRRCTRRASPSFPPKCIAWL